VIQTTYPPNPGSGSRWRTRTFVAVFLLVLGGGLAYTFLRPAEYRSSATLAISKATPTAVAARAAGSALPDVGGAQQAETDPAAVVAEVHRLLAWPLLVGLQDRLRESMPDAARSANELQHMLAANPVTGTNVIELSAEGESREGLPLILQSWIDLYIEERGSRQAKEGSSNRAELEQQRAGISQRLDEKRAELEAFRARHDIVSMESENNAIVARTKGLNTALAEATKKLAETEAKVTAMRRDIAAGKLVLRREDRSDVVTMQTRAREMREQLREVEKSYTDQYIHRDPRLRALRENLAALEHKIAEQSTAGQHAALAEAEQDFSGAEQTLVSLRRQLEENKAAVMAFTARFAEHKALLAEVDQLEEMARLAQNRLVQAEMHEASRLPKVVVVAPPSFPETHIRPFYTRDAAVSLGVAIGIGLLAVWLVDFLRRSERPAFDSQPLVHIAIPPGGSVGALGTTASPALAAPALALPSSPAPPRELSAPEVSALWSAAGSEGRVVLAGLLSGLTAAELTVLRGGDVDRDAGTVRAAGDSPRLLYLSSALRAALAGYPLRETGAVLGDQSHGPLSPADLEGLIAAAAHDAGLSNPGEVGSDVIRHTYLAFLVRQGARFSDLPRVAGHIPPATYSLYGPLSPPGPARPLAEVCVEYPLAGDASA
jgi:uncharacterized protein involved in exopolysaccharide biosynthesis